MYTKHDLPYVRGTNLGVDPSLNHTGLCVLDQHEVTTLKIEPKGLRGMPRLIYLRDELQRVLEDVRPDRVMIEGYAFSRGDRAHQKGEWGGILRVLLFEAECPLYEVPPNTLKKFVTNKGDGPKSAMMLALYKRWGLEIPDEDEADAAGLAIMAAYLRAPDLCHPTVPQREALTKVNVIRPFVRQRQRRLQRGVKI